jgi:hypothetical protein
MTISPRVWLATFIALVLMIGVSAGVLIDRTFLLRGRDGGRFVQGGPNGPGDRGGRGGPGGPGGQLVGPPPDRIVADLDAELHLSEAQRDQIRAILDAHRPRVRELQDAARKTFSDEQKLLQDEIAKALTADQATRFREMRARQPELGPGGPGGGRRGPGGPGRREGR